MTPAKNVADNNADATPKMTHYKIDATTKTMRYNVDTSPKTIRYNVDTTQKTAHYNVDAVQRWRRYWKTIAFFGKSKGQGVLLLLFPSPYLVLIYPQAFVQFSKSPSKDLVSNK